MMVEQENIDPMHVIENSNAFSTPQTPDVKGKARPKVCFLKGLTPSLVFGRVPSPCLC